MPSWAAARPGDDAGPTNETRGKALKLVKLSPREGVSVVEQLRFALIGNFSRVADLFRDWDEDRNG